MKQGTRFVRFVRWGLVFLTLSPIHGQLYLITGSPNPKEAGAGYPSALLKVGNDGAVERGADLAAGTEWLTVSYDLGKALILARYPDTHITVVDLAKATVVKTCEDPPGPIGGLMDQWLIDSPSAGPVFAEALLGDTLKIRGMRLSASVPCEESFVYLDTSEVRFAQTSGWAGVADVTVADVLSVGIDPDGRPWAALGAASSHLGLTIPTELLKGMGHPGGAIYVNNRQVLVVGLGDGDNPSNQRNLLFRKRDQTWWRVPIQSERTSWARGFGSFLVITEAQTKNERNKESAGTAEWQRKNEGRGPNIAHRFLHAPEVFPGRLHIYDAETEQVYTIVTNQGDSEVILIQDSVIYYRVSDRLYEAAIDGKEISKGRLLATSEDIRDAHWAFIKR